MEEHATWRQRAREGMADAVVSTAEAVITTMERRTVNYEMGRAVWDHLPLVLEALSDFAEKGQAASLAHLTVSANCPDRENKARQRSEALDMLHDAEQADQLRQWLLEAGQRLNDRRLADFI
ncbi:hypothetical protein [Kitasatospora sp. NPDC004272]